MKLVSFFNLGNTCYINSVLQCFIYNNYFQVHCKIPELEKVINNIDLNDNKEEFIEYDISDFLNFIFDKKKCFKKFQQNDAHEFLIEFLDILTQDVYLNTYGCVNESWDHFLKQNNYNPFISGYHGQTKLNIKCQRCHKSKDVYEEFNNINLNIPNNSDNLDNLDITTLLLDYLKKETVNDPNNLYYCEHCYSNQISDRKILLNILPKILILVLKRYSENGTKILSEIKYDQILYIKNGKSIIKYSLVSIIHHFGNLYNGHYTSSVKINKNWYYIDDCSIIKSENKDMSSAYILFYESE